MKTKTYNYLRHTTIILATIGVLFLSTTSLQLGQYAFENSYPAIPPSTYLSLSQGTFVGLFGTCFLGFAFLFTSLLITAYIRR